MSEREAGLSDELRRLVVERSHDLVTMIDPAGTIVYASPSWQAMLGYDPSAVVGTSLYDYVHPDDMATGHAAIVTQGEGNVVDSVVTRRRTADGRWLYIESSSQPVFDADGNVVHIIGSARDVTESYELRRHVLELNALYRVAGAVATTTTAQELFDEALAALIDATAADRASLLLYDAGVMRFRAWKRLSESYRAATDGHSPWTADTPDPQPLLVPDVAAGLDGELETAAKREGIGALAFVPIVHARRLLGMFMLYRDVPQEWDDRDIRLASNIAHHLGSATVRMQTTADLRASREQLETIMATVDEGIIVQAPDLSRIYANEAATVLANFELLDETGAPLSPDELPGRRAFDGATHERTVRYRRRDTGGERWSLIRANPIRGHDGTIVATVSVIHDVTERRAADIRAREASALVEGVFRNAPVGLAFWDSELRYVRVNEALLRMNELQAEAIVGRHIFEIAPDLEDSLGPLLEQVQQTGEPVLDVDIQRERRLWRASFFLVRDAGVGGVIEDVTAPRRVEERARLLARATELLNETLDVAQTFDALAGLAVPTFAGHVTVDLYEDGALRLVGARHVDEEKTPIVVDLRAAYPPTMPDHPVQLALATGAPQLIADVRAAASSMAHDPEHAATIRELDIESGVVVPLMSRGRTFGAITFATVAPQPPFDDADVELAIELGMRASAALENALLYAEAQARAHAADALHFVGDGVFLVDRGGIVRLWNPAAAKTFRIRAETALGRHVADTVADWETVAERVRPGRRAETLPVQIRDEERWLSATAAEFPGGTVYAFRDLTQERAIEQLRSDFVSTVSHELRTPLAAIYGAALTLQRDDIRLEESQRTGLLGVISSEADRLARIVNDILWASRLDSGQMGMAIESCDAEALTIQIVDALRHHASEQIVLDVDAEPGLPPVAADPDKLRQVLTNLVDNALKYSPDGGHVYVLITRSGNRIRWRVQDNGLGIPPGEQQRIFEKFFRLDPQLTRGVGGTGLGLYICRELVQRMHGRIGVNSDGSSGSTFWLELPAAG